MNLRDRAEGVRFLIRDRDASLTRSSATSATAGQRPHPGFRTPHVVDTFDDTSNWDFWSLRATGTASSAPDGHAGNGLKLDYDFTQSTQTRGVGIWPSAGLLPVAGQPAAFKLWVKSEGHDQRTRLEVVDRDGTLHTIEPAFITEPGWQQITYDVPDGMAYPVSLHRVRIGVHLELEVHTDPAWDPLARGRRGHLVLDGKAAPP
ncbi:hypothetical protein B0I32_109149 [Nonomuraea fuscirosea]|uniref:Uncharacterized protein n=1 Tax=Nonomuraea fuscirosea TaxID=1291556 RepID=A0A2T0MYC0_9ACTN|nr:hypothetical protein B0I32_109149 [Nonomuraea fuscirosea]